jgi:hypothetical protein
MAAVVGTVSAKHGTTKPVGPLPTITIGGVEHEVFVHYVEVIFPAGTYVQADDATIDPTTVLQSSRSGKTFVVLNAMCAGHGDENGSIVGLGLVSDITTNVITAPIVQEDGTTERGASAMSAVWNRPITVALYVAETPAD